MDAVIKFTLIKEGTLPPFSDREYWDELMEACERLGLNFSHNSHPNFTTLLDAHKSRSFPFFKAE